MTEKLDENFIKSLVVIALGIVRGRSDPYELVNGAMEYLISNKERYMDHPNIKALAVLKMKGLFIDGIRKNQKMNKFELKSITENLIETFQFAGRESIKLYSEGLEIKIKEKLDYLKTLDEAYKNNQEKK